MPKYSFTAKSLQGEPFSGVREAKDERELARALRQEGHLLITAEIAEKKRKFEPSLPFFTRVSLQDKLIFTRNLRVMISAGISLPKALKTLAQQSKNKHLKKILEEISEAIIRGGNFSDSLSQYPKTFSELFCDMIKVGEESGTLEESLQVLTRQLEREHELSSKIKSAMIYPAVVVAAMIGIGILMLIVAVPKLAQAFEELEIELPLTTKIVIALGNFLANKWYLVILFFFLLIFLVSSLLKIKSGKKFFDYLVLKVPIIASLIKKTNSAYTVRTLGSLISAGVPLVRSLEIVSGTLSNFYFKQAIAQSLERVKKGEKFSETLKTHQDLYPVSVVQMIAVGEETGETSSILEKLADFFEEEVGSSTKNLAAVIEPILMLLIGGVVGFFAVSMIQPIYSMLQAIE